MYSYFSDSLTKNKAVNFYYLNMLTWGLKKNGSFFWLKFTYFERKELKMNMLSLRSVKK